MSQNMSRIKSLDPTQATGKTKELLDGVQTRLGKTPNMMLTMAQSPAVLGAYLNFSRSLERGSLTAKAREQIALGVAQANDCDYCLAAHTALGATVGLKDEEIASSRTFTADDPKVDAALKFASIVVENRGEVSNDDLQQARTAGLTDGEITEVIANVALNIFTNYINLVALTEIDFPPVREMAEAA